VMNRRGIPVPQLRPAEVADLIAYLYSVRYFGGAGDVGRGRQLLTAKGCLDCHSVGGQGGKTAADLTAVRGLDAPAAVIATLWNHSFAGERPGDRGRPWPELRPADVADLGAFLGTLGRTQ
jgi:mono/diheme cytochrome c family protein